MEDTGRQAMWHFRKEMASDGELKTPGRSIGARQKSYVP